MEIITKSRRKENQVIWYFISLSQFSIKLRLIIATRRLQGGIWGGIH